MPAFGWLAWDGTRWLLDRSGEVNRRAHHVACNLEAGASLLLAEAAQLAAVHRRAAAEQCRAEATMLQRWAKASQSDKRITACIKIAQTLLSAPDSDFDRDPWLLNCQNGTLDLRTSSLRPHAREDYITQCCAVAFDADAEAPHWPRMLERILPDREVRAFVQRFAGDSLTGSTQEQCFVVCYGDGANGKSWAAMPVMPAPTPSWTTAVAVARKTTSRDSMEPGS